jgi:hypothetical protein
MILVNFVKSLPNGESEAKKSGTIATLFGCH